MQTSVDQIAERSYRISPVADAYEKRYGCGSGLPAQPLPEHAAVEAVS
jgi:hypothetical protein